MRGTVLCALLCVHLVAIATMASVVGGQAAAGDRRLGFSTSLVSEHRRAEGRYAAAVSSERIAAVHRQLTRRPHMAGVRRRTRSRRGPF